mmetsp:Transcript_34669/g.101910  ORF Transcript_34669/g.101910 Transcript_34669/m.101910 type:complete len:405 (-) Transcript_34669:194-1408(-)|eukprot:CAMPEP_0181049462 /NCGR_PEP_ID=MMETSP1070-20121207/15994_1 /TAXON_ID=265543 /ORGANISM="Minutocellus polymorphus, Strain NH13" /LENGTH=404 /DNA_ID=CAMNT_0023128339 /DNA_START=40 /DNA_END=1254 /DNA_ORIENTATION=+
MKLQAITLAAFLAVAATSADAKQGGVRRKPNKKKTAAHKKKANVDAGHKKNTHQKKQRELGSNKKKSSSSSKSNKCKVPIFPTKCDSGDLQPSWVGVKGEVCLAAGNSLCRKRTNWQFGVTAPMPVMGGMPPGMGGMPMDPIPGPDKWGMIPPKPDVYPGRPGTNCPSTGCPMPPPGTQGQAEPYNGMPAMMPGDRKLGNKKKTKPSGWYGYGTGTPMILPTPMMPPVNLPEPPLPYNLTDASAHLWRGDDCDPVWSFPQGTTDVCVGMVGEKDFPDGAFAASSYMVFKNVVAPDVNPLNATSGDVWLIFHPLIGGDWTKMPRLKLDTDIENQLPLKFKRGPDGKDDEDVLMAIDKDGEAYVNPYGQLFYAEGGNRTKAVELDLGMFMPPEMMMSPEMMTQYGW